MKLLFSILIATFYGLSIRMLFDMFGDALSIMGLSFFFLLPFLIGYLTIFLLPYKEKHTATGAFFKPSLTCMVILAVTIYFNIEGAICWIMAFPIFAFFAGAGGLVAFNRKRRRYRRNIQWDFEKEDWEKTGSLKLSFLLLIPLLVGAIEGDKTSSFESLTVEKKVTIPASPDIVWNALTQNKRSAPKIHHTSLAGILGFPYHLSTTIDTFQVGGSRVAAYEKGLTFMETIKKIEPGRSLVVAVTTDASQISKAIMDEHIVIGGRHIQMQEDEYKLEALPNGQTQLTLSSRFSINTPFNWYAGIWARWLMSDILSEETEQFRTENGQSQASVIHKKLTDNQSLSGILIDPHTHHAHQLYQDRLAEPVEATLLHSPERTWIVPRHSRRPAPFPVHTLSPQL